MARVKTIERIQRYLDDCAARGHLSPTLREIADGVGLKSTNTAAYHVRKLVTAGSCQQDAGGRIQLQREPVAAWNDFLYLDGEAMAFEVPEELEQRLRKGRIYHIEVYAHD